MRRHDALRPTAMHVTAPAVIGSIALSLSTLTGAPSPAAAAESAPAAPRPLADRPTATHVDVVGVPAASSSVRTHTVAHGDTVSAVAARHGLRTADVLAWNDLSWRSVIRPGDVLRLGAGPAKAATRKKAASPDKDGGTSQGAGVHTVRTGDTLWAIAGRYDVTVAALAEANSLGRSTMIRPGQKVTIPGTQQKVQRAAGRTAAPTASPRTATAHHEVGSGETLWAIADRHGISLSRLLAANDLDGGSIIYPGQKLTIPGTAPIVARTAADAADVVLDDDQIANVRLIIEVGRSRGVSRDGIAVALSTAMVESWIRNLDWGDRDSLGLFQQRPSAGWGTEDQVRDRRRAAAAFFGGPQDPNGQETRGLLDVPGWQKMDLADAAQAVQISAYPERYGIWEKQAHRWIDVYG
ncbi:LysM peptidoglycan-binding domain-containing protein [Microbacterium sp. 179-B 1A2 NHS]|uniref:LysM peptidoglycan-binding domain-containing protein n=1 Tax=Microbacterium sp. 179-B 1A2 NHS TaxID=3142383 RepID=UPI0039A2187B